MKHISLALSAFFLFLSASSAQTLPKEILLIWADAADARGEGRYETAIDLMGKAIAEAPDHGPLYNSFGKTYFDMAVSGKFDNASDSLLHLAIQMYNKGLGCKDLPDTVQSEILVNRGAAHGVMNHMDVAVQDFNAGIRLDPKNKHGYLNRSIAYNQLGQYAKAIKDLSSYLKFDQQNATILYERGMLYRVLKKNKKAIADLTRALYLKPSLGIAYLERARAYAQCGKKMAAKHDYEQAKRMGLMLEPWDLEFLK